MRRPFVAGFATALAARALLMRVLLVKLRRDVGKLNSGDPAPLLAGYAEDAILRFNPGEHRWAGDHVGKPAIGRFLAEFVAARIQGDILELWMGGPLWALTLVVRFDDHAEHGGERVYENRTMLLARTRWGRIVEQEDFYEDTSRIDAFDRRLTELGISRVA